MQGQMNFPELNLPTSFDGPTFEPAEDRERLTAQLAHVRELMSDGAWWSIPQLADALWKSGRKATPQGISARIRDLRKARFGGRTVDRKRVNTAGDHKYRLVPEAEVRRRKDKLDRELRESIEVLG